MLPAELQSFLDEIRDLPDFAGRDESVIGVLSRGLFGGTPLHVAAIRGDTRMIALLLDAGAEIDARGEYGHTPIHEAVGQEHVEAVRLLLSRGADCSIANDWGQTPKQSAKIGGKHEIENLFSAVA
ncbi:MAG: ankyrin repeat domain-containing protein [Verrucomicrobiota bacterium]